MNEDTDNKNPAPDGTASGTMADAPPPAPGTGAGANIAAAGGVSEPAAATSSSQRGRLVPPDGKPLKWWLRHREKIYLAEWIITVVFTLLFLYYLWFLLFTPGPRPVASLAPAVPPSQEEFRRLLRAFPPPGEEPGWKVAARSGRWRGIVIHHSATDTGSAESFDRHHREANKWPNGLGYHFVIGNGRGMPDGGIAVGRRWLEQAVLDGSHLVMADAKKSGFGAAEKEKANAFTVGIALVGNFEVDLPTGRQLASLLGLLDFLCREYDIGHDAIVGHGDVSARHTACPGQWFFVGDVVAALDVI